MHKDAYIGMLEAQTKQLSDALFALGFAVRKSNISLPLQEAKTLSDALDGQRSATDAYSRFYKMTETERATAAQK